jgi:hypothetical protein
LYFPDLILASAGFSASFGKSQAPAIFFAPTILPSLHKTAILRTEIPHSELASLIVNISIKPPLLYILYHGYARISRVVFYSVKRVQKNVDIPSSVK